jgi:endonuclease/exonuclease/phosphatase family metal-dependent hydrolase
VRTIVCLILSLLLQPAFGQGLKVATWNMDWLTWRSGGDPALPADVAGSAGKDWARLRDYASALDADVVALEEVDGPEAARRVFPQYQLFFTHDEVVQRVGFALRPGLHATANPDLVGLVLDPSAVHPLRSGEDITLDLPGDLPGGKLRLLAVHLKSGCQRDPLERSRRRACPELRAQIPVLQGWVAQRVREGVPFLVLGDLNREMDRPEELWTALRDTAPLTRATEGRGDPCWGGGSFIDHIIAGGAARGWMQTQTLRVLVYREQGEAWRDRLSDHCPVSVRLAVP